MLTQHYFLEYCMNLQLQNYMTSFMAQALSLIYQGGVRFSSIGENGRKPSLISRGESEKGASFLI